VSLLLLLFFMLILLLRVFILVLLLLLIFLTSFGVTIPVVIFRANTSVTHHCIDTPVANLFNEVWCHCSC
jgi:hypothetical protein